MPKTTAAKTAPNALAAVVERTMKEKNLSSYDVQRRSEDAGSKIDQSFVVKIKNGQAKNPSMPKLKALAAGLGVAEQIILSAAGENAQKGGSKTQEITAYVAELPDSVQDDLLLIVKSLHQKHARKN